MDSPLASPVSSSRRLKGRFSCRRLDKLCCLAASYFPLLFVYGTSTWAIYTEAYSICYRNLGGWKGTLAGGLGVLLYAMALWSYTFAVFTNPGSPLETKHAYSHLPTSESAAAASQVTVKSDGQDRFCKKCQCRKPDRAHHCSTCRTCVLKMDHHCPWLANCLGLYNYKAFLLFLIYTSLLSVVCFVVSCSFVYSEFFNDATRYPGTMDDLGPVNWVLLAVVSGVIGLVLGGFTVWHLVLTGSNMTTIESLEKVRYTAPSLRRGLPPPGAHLVDENDYSFNAQRYHEQRRYATYLLEESSKKLPHAFNLGTRDNYAQVFGGREKALYWFVPMFSGEGDGWTWPTSPQWRDAVEAQKAEREEWLRRQDERERAAGWGGGFDPADPQPWNRTNPNGLVQHAGAPRQSKADKLLGRLPGSYSDAEGIPLRKVRKPLHEYEIDLDDEEEYLDDVEEDARHGDVLERAAATTRGRAEERDGEWGSWGD